MDEESFEKKKSSKKAVKIVALVVVLLAIATVVTWFVFNQINSKPEKVFEKAVGEMFEETEKAYSYKTEKLEMDISAEIKAKGITNSEITSQINMINLVLKTVSLNLKVGVDLESQVYDGEITARYMGQDLITFDSIIQDNKMYFYLKDLYSKYIEVPQESIEGIDLASIFQTSKIDQQLMKDIEEILKAKIEDSDIESEEDEIEVEGKDTKVNKSTLTLTTKEIADLSSDILNKVKEYDISEEAKEMVEEMLADLKYLDETKNVLVIDIYTEKLANKIVGYDMKAVNNEDNEVIVLNAVKTDKKTWEISFGMNENSTDASEATNFVTVAITEENDNEGKIAITLNIEEEGFELTVNIDYKAEYDVDIEKRDIKNTIKADDLTEADLAEIMENVEKNEMLYTLVESFMEGFNEGLNGGSSSYYSY